MANDKEIVSSGDQDSEEGAAYYDPDLQRQQTLLQDSWAADAGILAGSELLELNGQEACPRCKMRRHVPTAITAADPVFQRLRAAVRTLELNTLLRVAMLHGCKAAV